MIRDTVPGTASFVFTLAGFALMYCFLAALPVALPHPALLYGSDLREAIAFCFGVFSLWAYGCMVHRPTKITLEVVTTQSKIPPV